MKRAIGFFCFAAISFLHFWAWHRIVVISRPWLSLFAGSLFLLLWIAVLRGFYWAMKRPTPASVFALVYMLVLVNTWCFVWPGPGGIPVMIADQQQWKDPKHLLTPQTKYLLVYHSVVLGVLNKDEYAMCLSVLLCYFTSGAMCFAAFIVLPFGDIRLFPRDNVKQFLRA
jgi:hypothetical protein